MAESSLQAFRQQPVASDRYTLADLMRERYEHAGQGMDTLSASVPEAGPPTTLSRLRDFHAWVTRNMLEPIQYAGFYPPRVLGRHMDPTGTDPFWHPRASIPGAPIATKRDWDVVTEALGGITQAAPAYAPGERQSDQIEDRRWNPSRSIWEF